MNTIKLCASDDWPITPWPLLGGAGVAVGLAFLAALILFRSGPAAPGQGSALLLLLLPGLLAAGGAVTLRPGAPAVVAASGVLALLAGWSLNPLWDSARLVLYILAFIALASAVLLALPEILGRAFVFFQGEGLAGKHLEQLRARGQAWGRALGRGGVSVLVLLHFISIASAIMSVPTPGGPSSWLAQRWWSGAKPYLQFSYLTNAYRFYSPEPGPPSLLWFVVFYDDGTSREIKLPNRKEHHPDPLGQEYYRRLSIGESVNGLLPPGIPEEVRRRRFFAAELYGIPPHPDLMLELQYRVPEEHCRILVGDYARYVARHYPSLRDPTAEVVGVKVYRVVHRMLFPDELTYPNANPAALWTYWPYYLGEFTKDGILKDPADPFLYWIIPIFQKPQKPWAGGSQVSPDSRRLLYEGGFDVIDCMKIHAPLKTGPQRN